MVFPRASINRRFTNYTAMQSLAVVVRILRSVGGFKTTSIDFSLNEYVTRVIMMPSYHTIS